MPPQIAIGRINMASKKNATISEAEMRKIELTTKEKLDAQPKVTVYIAPDEHDPMWRGCVNGVDYKFPRGQLIDVPETLADIIRSSTRMQEIKKAHEQVMVDTMDLGTL